MVSRSAILFSSDHGWQRRRDSWKTLIRAHSQSFMNVAGGMLPALLVLGTEIGKGGES